MPKRYAEERAADRDRGRCEEILCVRTGSVASSRETSLSRRGTSQERESSEDKTSHEPNDEVKPETAQPVEKEQVKTESTAMKTEDSAVTTSQASPPSPKSPSPSGDHPDTLQLQAAEMSGTDEENENRDAAAKEAAAVPVPAKASSATDAPDVQESSPSRAPPHAKKVRGTVADSSSSGSESGDDTAAQQESVTQGKHVRTTKTTKTLRRQRPSESGRSSGAATASEGGDSSEDDAGAQPDASQPKHVRATSKTPKPVRRKARSSGGGGTSASATDDESSGSSEEEDVTKGRRLKSQVVQAPPQPAPPAPAPPSRGENPVPKKRALDPMLTRTGGAYIPPAKLREMQKNITDKGSLEYQRIAWEALKKSINGLVNKVNVSNIKEIIFELFRENLIRGRGVLARSIMQAQAFSPTFTHVYAALVAVLNSKFPQTGELILKRTILQFKRGFRRNDKAMCVSSVKFLAHLFNQQVAHEVVVLEILTLLLEKPTEDSVEVAIAFLKEAGQMLTDVSPRGVLAIMERLRHILHEGSVDKRCQYMIEVLAAVRKEGFKDHPNVVSELDLVQEADQFTHMINLDEVNDGQDGLNVFKFDALYEENEEKYQGIYKSIVGDSGSSSGSGSSGSSSESSGDEEDAENKTEDAIVDMTETNMVALRRTIFLTIQSSLNFEECVHKLLKLEIKPNQIPEMCHMVLDCCAQQRTYEKFFSLVAQRLCMIRREYMEPFCEIFVNAYETVHRLDTNKLRNCAKFFANLLHSDAIPWQVLSVIKLGEETTNSSSRIFIKILFQELAEFMGLVKLNARVKDPTLQEAFDGLFPRDSPQNTRFAINFYTSIGLGGLTDDLREHLKTMPKKPPPVAKDSSSSSSSSSSSTSSSSDSSDSSDSDDSSSTSSSSSSSSSSPTSSSSSDNGGRRKKLKKPKKKAAPKHGRGEDSKERPAARGDAGRDQNGNARRRDKDRQDKDRVSDQKATNPRQNDDRRKEDRRDNLRRDRRTDKDRRGAGDNGERGSGRKHARDSKREERDREVDRHKDGRGQEERKHCSKAREDPANGEGDRRNSVGKKSTSKSADVRRDRSPRAPAAEKTAPSAEDADQSQRQERRVEEDKENRKKRRRNSDSSGAEGKEGRRQERKKGRKHERSPERPDESREHREDRHNKDGDHRVKDGEKHREKKDKSRRDENRSSRGERRRVDEQSDTGKKKRRRSAS